ncbi:MAG: ammonium transporter [Candidatus Margulisiibacteriota bacterium]
MNQSDITFMLISTALVMFMTPGLAFFYGGLVRRKNILSVLMQCFILLGILSIQWVLIGYSLSFAPSTGFWGGFQWIGLRGVSLAPNPDYAATIPHQLFMVFQMMFAIITPALIIGAFAERMKFSTFLLFSLLWATLVYAPVCHWVWGTGGWLKVMGVQDFAGGIVVHITAGMSALATALIIGKRKGVGKKIIPPHSLPFAVLGAGLLWFGWFGFNAGSALSSNTVAVSAFIATQMAAAVGLTTWALLEWFFNEKPTIFGTITGAIAGLAAVTPAAGFISIPAAMLIGLVSSLLCFFFVVIIKSKFKYDDALDAFGVHGIGGFLGTIATGIFATALINPASANGLIHGSVHLLKVQLIAALVVAAYSFAMSIIIYKVLDLIIGVRVSEHQENMGLDLSEHHEAAYTVLE